MTVQRFTRRPVTVEAMQFTPETAAQVAAWSNGFVTFVHDAMKLLVHGPHEHHLVNLGDWVISEPGGRFSTMDAVTFDSTYEEV